MRLNIVLIAAMLGLTPAVLAQNARSQERPAGETRRSPGARLERTSELMIQTLNLTPAQAEQLKVITDEFRPRFDAAIPRDPGADESEMAEARESHQKLMSEYMDRVETILTPEQTDRLSELRTRFTGEPRRGGRLERVLESLPEELQLTADQRKTFDELAAAWRIAREEQRTRIRTLTEQHREAQKAGDEQRVEDIRKQLHALRSGPDPSDAFYAGLEKSLTAEQKTKLAEIRDSSARRDRGPTLRVRAMVRAVERLDLTKEQRDAIGEFTRKAMREVRETKAEAELAERVKAEILGVLTPEQASQFEEALKQRPERARRRHAESRPAEQGAPQGPKQP